MTLQIPSLYIARKRPTDMQVYIHMDIVYRAVPIYVQFCSHGCSARRNNFVGASTPQLNVIERLLFFFF